MNREFLKGLGIEDEQVDKIMAEHGKTVGDTKKQLETVTTEKNELAEKVENLNNTLTATNEKYEGFDEQLANATKELEASKVQNTKFRIANQQGIPLELAGRLSGETEEEILADAEKLSGFVSQKNTLPLGSTEPKNLDDEDAGLKKMLDNLTKQE